MLLAAGDANGALPAFASTMAKEPNRFRGLSGGAAAAEQAGNRQLAGQYYSKLLQVATSANPDRAELQRARALVSGGR